MEFGFLKRYPLYCQWESAQGFFLGLNFLIFFSYFIPQFCYLIYLFIFIYILLFYGNGVIKKFSKINI